ncbi:hypothetical protein BGX28_003105 [Mortierella sp. GBA30]|nr:hypothetical protein BGX28_003105 [Mortierella sp. GBA30]
MTLPTTLSSRPQPSRWLARTLFSATLLAVGAQALCVSLAGSTACPSFSTLMVDNSFVKRAVDFGIQMQTFTTTLEFDQSAANATAFRTSTSCTGYNSTIRIPYQDTVLCTIAVQDPDSMKCKGYATNATNVMCVSSCGLYLGGLTSLVNQHCPNDANAKSSLKEVTDVCTEKTPNNWPDLQDKSTNCINALNNEALTCGLGSHGAKCTYCMTNSTATCCQDAATTCNYPTSTSSNAGPTGTSLNATPTGATAGDGSNGSGSTNSGGLSPTAVKGIIGGAVGLVVIAAAVFLCMRRAKRQPAAKSGLSRQISNSSGRYNISSPKIQEEGFAASTTPIPMTTLPPITQEPMSFGGMVGGAAVAGAAAGAGAVAAAEVLGGKEATGKQSYCQALYPYQASMADELDLTPGDIINVQRVFDDGWAVGVNMNTSNEGAFPVVCVMFVDESALDDDFEDVNMHSMTPMTLREEDQEGRHSPSGGRNSPRSSLPSRSSSPVHLPRRNSSIRDSTVSVTGGNPMTSSPLAGNGGRLTPQPVRDTMLSDASSINRWWDGEGAK